MLACVFLLVMLHPVHETAAEVQWNSESKRLEVALRLDMQDEQWIRRQMTKSGDSEKTSSWALKYLSQRFRIARLPQQNHPDSTRYHWIGRSEEGAHRWWYFEIQPLDGQVPQWIDQRVLLDRESNYTHRVLILNHTPPRAVNVTSGHSRVRLNNIDHESSTGSPSAR